MEGNEKYVAIPKDAKGVFKIDANGNVINLDTNEIIGHADLTRKLNDGI